MAKIGHIEKTNNNNNNNNNNIHNNGLCLQLSLSAMAIYPFPFLPISSCDDTTRDLKRPKRSHSLSPDNNTNNNNNNNNNFRFRDYVSTYSQRYVAAEAVEDAIIAAGVHGGGGGTRDSADGGELRLVRLLIAGAEAVACRDRAHATALLAELRPESLVFGSSFQRVASCFAQGLSERLAAVTPVGLFSRTGPAAAPRPDSDPSERRSEALRLAYKVCPHIRFGHHVANRAILEAFERECYVHVIDLGMSLGLPAGNQWRDLLRDIAASDDHPVERVRITAVGLDEDRYLAIGEKLRLFATTLGITLEFNVVKSTLEDLRREHIPTAAGEVVVVNSVLQLHRVVKESRGALNLVLHSFHELRPKTLVLVEQDSSHNGPFFLGRFMEALHYYAAIFDSLDAALPKYDTARAKVEQFHFAEEIKNIVSCEGPARVERHERVDQWRRRMSRAGFQAAPIRAAAAEDARRWLGEQSLDDGDGDGEGYTVVEEKGCLVLGWKSRPIVAVSCWKC